MLEGFVRVAAAVPRVRLGDAEANGRAILDLLRRADAAGASVVVFPELCLTGYTARDLFHDGALLAATGAALDALIAASADLAPLALVGLPLRAGGQLFNAAAAIQGGRLLGLVPKAYLPTSREYEEARWFAPGRAVPEGATARAAGREAPFGVDLLFAAEEQPRLVLGVEICEDMWVPAPPSAFQVAAGATVIANLSASNMLVGKAGLRRRLARAASDRGKCAYVYVAAGAGESTTDLAFDGDAFVCENGGVLAEGVRFRREPTLLVADVDLDLLAHERLTTSSFGDFSRAHRRRFRRVPFAAPAAVPPPLRRAVTPRPFLPADPTTLAERLWEVFEIQTSGLATRVEAAGAERLVLGLSGGLDSTHAALVCAAALDLLRRPRDRLLCATMPGLGTTERTRGSAVRLARALGAELREIDIQDLSREVLAAAGHPAADGAQSAGDLLARLRADPSLADVTVENAQARLRTLLLMTLANREGGIVVGTGDLSEKALGWSTYAGDQISMYDVNAGVPKTLIRHLVGWVRDARVAGWSAGDPPALAAVLADILATPISPELLPAGEGGDIAQRTEETLGPYEVHDFFLYHLVRHGARPRRILDLAAVAFAGHYDLDDLKRWLALFLRRFFANQFKRSCTPDAPKVGMVALSPRADWRMPSDATPAAWLAEVERYGA